MHNLKKYSVLFLSLVFLFSCADNPTSTEPEYQEIKLDNSEQEIVDSLNNYISPLHGTTPNIADTDLAVFDKFAGTTVIGLGEATHGTKEFFQMKHRLFKYFVENHGYRIFGFEADIGETIYIDRFITKGIGSIEYAMKKMHFWTWSTNEVRDLILWMREYNIAKNEENKIHLIGVDCQYTDYNKALIEDYLNSYSDEYPNYINTILGEVTNFTYNDGESIDSDQKLLLKTKCDSVLTFFEENKNNLISRSGNFEYDIIVRLIVQNKQFLDVITDKTYNYRDYYMAQNTIWLTSLLGPETKVISWAHNGHVAKNPSYSSGSQGHYLSEEFRENYKVIGFSFGRGTFRASNFDQKTNSYTGVIKHNITRLPLRESFNYIFQAATPKDFIIIFSNIPQSNLLYSWFNTMRKFMSIGGVYSIDYYDNFYRENNLSAYFDAIIHINKTNSAVGY